MESLAYENAIPMEVGPPPLRGEVWILGRRYNLPGGASSTISSAIFRVYVSISSCAIRRFSSGAQSAYHKQPCIVVVRISWL